MPDTIPWGQYRSRGGVPMPRSVEFRDTMRRWLDQSDMSLHRLHEITGISRDTLRSAVNEGKHFNPAHLRKVASALGLNRSEWEKFDPGEGLTLPSEELFWRNVMARVSGGPFSDDTLRLFEQFLQSAHDDIDRLSA